MSEILDKDSNYVIVRYTTKEYNDLFIDHNLYELSDSEITKDLSHKLDKSLKIPKNLLVNI